MSLVETLNDENLNRFNSLQAALGPTNAERTVYGIEQRIEQGIDNLGENAMKGVAVAAVVASVATIAPNILGHGSAPHKVRETAAELTDVKLIGAERKAAAVVITQAAESSVDIAPGVKSYFEAPQRNQPIAPQAVMTAAEVTSVAKETQLPVTIKSMATINPADTSKPVEVNTPTPNVLIVTPNNPSETPKLVQQYEAKHADTVIADPASVPASTPQIFENTVVSAVAAANILQGLPAGSIAVDINPVQPTQPVHAESIPATTSTTTAPSTTVEQAPQHNFDPTNPVDATYLSLKNATVGPNNTPLSNKAIFAIMGNLEAEGRLHPGTLENTPIGQYVTIESLSEATLNNTGIGYGIAQWTPAIKLLNEAKQLGVNPDSLSGQITVLLNDLQQEDIKNPGSTYLQSIEAAPTLASATAIMESHWERPTTTDDAPTRAQYAAEIEAFITQNTPLPFQVISLTPTELGTTPASTPTTTVPPTTSTTESAPTTTLPTPTTSTTNQNTVSSEMAWLNNLSSSETSLPPSPEELTTTSPPTPSTPPTTAKPETATQLVGNTNAAIVPGNAVNPTNH